MDPYKSNEYYAKQWMDILNRASFDDRKTAFEEYQKEIFLDTQKRTLQAVSS